jgi:formylglycine-generating enzyme required for sulfatase activity
VHCQLGQNDFFGLHSYQLDSSKPEERDYAVVSINLEDTEDYLKWLFRTVGKAYRLPSEAEFEYAARSGTQTAYPWGNDPDPDRVTSFDYPANQFGLRHMLGSVWQWTADCYHKDYDGAPDDGSARNYYSKPGDLSGCVEATVRGGYRPRLFDLFSENSDSEPFRTASRKMAVVTDQIHNIGFRVARTLEDKSRPSSQASREK